MPNKDKSPQTASDGSVAKNFSDLPMRELISAPLNAAAESQFRLAETSLNFINKIGFEDNGGNPRLLKFDLERPVETPSGIETNTVKVQAPLLGLVPVPALLIEDVHVDFQMEVTSTEASKSNTTAEAGTSASYKSWFGASAEIHGKVTTSRENTRSTNQTAKYNVSVNARQQRPSEGLSRLMDILASCTAPLKVTKSSEANGSEK